MQDKLLKIQEVAVLLNCSVATINHWYRFKKNFPDKDICKLLPDFIQDGSRQTRYWKQSDIWKLIEFKQSVVKGRNGIMGAVTQKYYKKEHINEAS